jgi:hypothetical protein
MCSGSMPSKHWNTQHMVGRCVGFLTWSGIVLAGRSQRVTQAMFGQSIDQETPHHDQAEGHDALWFLQDDRGRQEERVLETGEAVLDAVLALVTLTARER